MDSASVSACAGLADHSYAKPWNWEMVCGLRWPTRILFQKKPDPDSRRAPSYNYSRVSVDVESTKVTSDTSSLFSRTPHLSGHVSIPLDQKVVEGDDPGSMSECVKRAAMIRLRKTGSELERDWEEFVNEHFRPKWSASQDLLFRRVKAVLLTEHLYRLVEEGKGGNQGGSNKATYAIARRNRLNNLVRRFRREVCHHLIWEPLLAEWLNNMLLDCLSQDLLAIYLDILMTMKSKAPHLLNKFLSQTTPTQSTHRHAEALSFLEKGSKYTWDPIPEKLFLDSTMKGDLPATHSPVVISVQCYPNQGHASGSSTTSKRWKLWNQQISCWAYKHIEVCPGDYSVLPSDPTGLQILDCIQTVTLHQIRESIRLYPGRPIVLFGWNYCASLILKLSCHFAGEISVLVCLGFPTLTLKGSRVDDEALDEEVDVTGDGEDSQPTKQEDQIPEASAPTVFVVGDRALNASPDDVEVFRERLEVRSLLVVAEEADEWLRLKKKRKEELGVTQHLADRAILSLCAEFVHDVIAPLPKKNAALAPSGSTESEARAVDEDKVSSAVDSSEVRGRTNLISATEEGREHLPAPSSSQRPTPQLAVSDAAAVSSTSRLAKRVSNSEGCSPPSLSSPPPPPSKRVKMEKAPPADVLPSSMSMELGFNSPSFLPDLSLLPPPPPPPPSSRPYRRKDSAPSPPPSSTSSTENKDAFQVATSAFFESEKRAVSPTACFSLQAPLPIVRRPPPPPYSASSKTFPDAFSEKESPPVHETSGAPGSDDLQAGREPHFAMAPNLHQYAQRQAAGILPESKSEPLAPRSLSPSSFASQNFLLPPVPRGRPPRPSSGPPRQTFGRPQLALSSDSQPARIKVSFGNPANSNRIRFFNPCRQSHPRPSVPVQIFSPRLSSPASGRSTLRLSVSDLNPRPRIGPPQQYNPRVSRPLAPRSPFTPVPASASARLQLQSTEGGSIQWLVVDSQGSLQASADSYDEENPLAFLSEVASSVRDQEQGGLESATCLLR